MVDTKISALCAVAAAAGANEFGVNEAGTSKKVSLTQIYAYSPGAIEFIIDGGCCTITTGIKGDLEIPFAATITRATALADVSGSIVVDIWKDSYANYPPVNGDSITASAPVTITTDTDSQDATLTGWTTAITAGDTLRYNVDSITTIKRVVISLRITKT